MEINTILIISSIIFQFIAEIRRSRCSHKELSSNGIIMDRKIIEEREEV